ncbi:unnamed protein product [Effrenium voratum]|nr:unnamed protein product [Effrenium voratum]
MGNSLRRYRTRPEVNHDSWRKPKAKSAPRDSKDSSAKAPDAAKAAASAASWVAGGVKSVGTGPGAAAGRSSAQLSSSTSVPQDDDDDFTEFSNLADAANKAWDELMTRKGSVKGKQEMNALFGLSELKDAVERSVKRVDVLQRQVATHSSQMAQKEAELDSLRRKFEATASSSTYWKLGDLAIRRGKGFCELSMVQMDVQPPFLEVRMSLTGSIVGTEAEKLASLSSQQEAAARASLKEYEKAKQTLADTEAALSQAQEELRQQHQSLTEQVEIKLKEPRAPPGLPDYSYLQKSEGPGSKAEATTAAAYPEVKGVKEDLRRKSPKESNFRSEGEAPASVNTAGTAMPRQAPSGPAGFPSFGDLSRMQKEAQEKDRQKEAKAASYPAPHSTREVFNRPEAPDGPGMHGGNAPDIKEASTRSASRDAPFIPAGMPGIPTGGGAGGSAAKVSLGQKKAQQEAFLHQQEAQLQREEAQREAQKQREEAERHKQEQRQKEYQASQEKAAASPSQKQQPQQSQQPETDWVRYRTPEGQVYYHNERTNHTSWSLPPGTTAREPAAAFQSGTTESQQEEPFSNLRKQEEENQKQREQWQQWYQQYTSWYSQQAGAGAAGGASGKQQQQQESAQVPPRGPAPPKLDANFEDHAVYQIKSSVLKEMESMVNQGMEVAKRKKALRFLQLKWHPDKNPDKLEIANSIFQFIEETKPWFLHDANAEA